MRTRVETEEKKKVQGTLDDLHKTIETLKNTNDDQTSRINRLQADYTAL